MSPVKMSPVNLLAVGLLLFATAACDSNPTDPSLLPANKPAHSEALGLSLAPASAGINESTISVVRNGSTDVYSWADLEGNWYRVEAEYDAALRLVTARAYLNGGFVGRTEPTWSGSTTTGYLATSQHDFWAQVNTQYEPVAWYGQQPGTCPWWQHYCVEDPLAAPSAGGVDPLMWGCLHIALDHAANSAVVTGSLLLLVGSIQTGTPIFIHGSALVLMGSLRPWWRSGHQLYTCVVEDPL
jgi:hypothetical protein